LDLVKEIVRNYQSEILAFTNEHLVKNEIMVRSEIISTLKDMRVQPGQYYELLCESLEALGYPV